MHTNTVLLRPLAGNCVLNSQTGRAASSVSLEQFGGRAVRASRDSKEFRDLPRVRNLKSKARTINAWAAAGTNESGSVGATPGDAGKDSWPRIGKSVKRDAEKARTASPGWAGPDNRPPSLVERLHWRWREHLPEMTSRRKSRRVQSQEMQFATESAPGLFLSPTSRRHSISYPYERASHPCGN